MEESKKTIRMDNETYIMIKNKQAELINTTGHFIQMQDISNLALQSAINDVHIENGPDGWYLSTEKTTCLKCGIQAVKTDEWGGIGLDGDGHEENICLRCNGTDTCYECTYRKMCKVWGGTEDINKINCFLKRIKE